MNGNPTKAQKDFHQWCRDRGCIIGGQSNPAIHHIKGSGMNLKGVDKPGEWFVIPVSFWWHDLNSGNPNAIHKNRAQFVKALSMTEKDWWITLMQEYKIEKGKYPMSDEAYEIFVDRA